MDIESYILGRKSAGGGGGGGGGDSDFSTAEVTFTNNVSGFGPFFMGAWEYDASSTGFPFDTAYPLLELPYSGTIEKPIILYRGKSMVIPLDDMSGTNVTLTGDAEDVDGAILVTGDCTITINRLASL